MYVVKCKSNFSGFSSVCKEDGKVLKFEKQEDAEKYAEESRQLMGINYHYWVAEE